MGIAGIIGLIMTVAPQAINLGELIAGAIEHRKKLQNTPDRTEAQDAELDLTQQLIDALQERADANAEAAKARQGTSDGS